MRRSIIVKADHELVALEPGLGNFPVVVGQDVVAMNRYSKTVLVKTIHKVESLWRRSVPRYVSEGCYISRTARVCERAYLGAKSYDREAPDVTRRQSHSLRSAPVS